MMVTTEKWGYVKSQKTKIIHIWNIFEEEALESRLCFSTWILLRSSLQTIIPCEQCIFFGGKFSQPRDKKKAHAKVTKGFLKKKDGLKSP